MNPLFLFAYIGALATTFVPLPGGTPPSLELMGTTSPNAVVHVVVDQAETYQQAGDDGSFTISVWGLDLGEHAIMLRASAKNSGESQQKQYVVTVAPGVDRITLSDIDLSIAIPSLSSNLQRFDLNKDGAFTDSDIFSFIRQYHSGNMDLDFDHDGIVTLKDFSIIMSYYLSIAR